MTLDKTSTIKTTLAHRRLGHLNIPAVKLLGKLAIGLDLDGNPQDGCDTCALVKSTRKATFERSTYHAKSQGELVHCDLGVLPTAVKVIGDYKYWLIIVDDYSRYGYVYLLKTVSSKIRQNSPEQI